MIVIDITLHVYPVYFKTNDKTPKLDTHDIETQDKLYPPYTWYLCGAPSQPIGQCVWP